MGPIGWAMEAAAQDECFLDMQIDCTHNGGWLDTNWLYRMLMAGYIHTKVDWWMECKMIGFVCIIIVQLSLHLLQLRQGMACSLDHPASMPEKVPCQYFVILQYKSLHMHTHTI